MTHAIGLHSKKGKTTLTVDRPLGPPNEARSDKVVDSSPFPFPLDYFLAVTRGGEMPYKF